MLYKLSAQAMGNVAPVIIIIIAVITVMPVVHYTDDCTCVEDQRSSVIMHVL
jgi:hypothetical protein